MIVLCRRILRLLEERWSAPRGALESGEGAAVVGSRIPRRKTRNCRETLNLVSFMSRAMAIRKTCYYEMIRNGQGLLRVCLGAARRLEAQIEVRCETWREIADRLREDGIELVAQTTRPMRSYGCAVAHTSRDRPELHSWPHGEPGLGTR